MRIYQPVAMRVGEVLRLNEAASHHLARVLRASVGEAVTLFNGQGGEYHGQIKQIQKKNVEVSLLAFVETECESPLRITLAQGIARGEKMDFIIQKAVELGVSDIQPLITERVNVRLSGEREEKRLAHWRSIVASACEQCGRNRLPEVHAPITLPAWLKTVNAAHRLVLSPWHTNNTITHHERNTSYALLIGPEGGLSEDEVRLAIQHAFHPWKLGPRILRTETATLAALSVLQFSGGDGGNLHHLQV